MYKMYDIGEGVWMWCREKEYPKNSYPLLQLSCSPEENFLIGTHKLGFLLYNINKINQNNGEESCTSLKLPNGVRNVLTAMNKSIRNIILYQSLNSVKFSVPQSSVRSEVQPH